MFAEVLRQGTDKLIRMGPKSSHDEAIGDLCPACDTPFVEGDYFTIVPLGPGDDPVARAKARQNRWYAAIGIEVHWACATGREETDGPKGKGKTRRVRRTGQDTG